MKKKITLLGSTGSIGTQTLEVIDSLLNIEVFALSANKNISLLLDQIEKYRPKKVAVTDENSYKQLKSLNLSTEIVFGMEGLIDISIHDEVDMVINSLIGNIGLIPTIKSIENKKDIALANKETLVAGGELVMSLAKDNGVKIFPIDSEHSAIFQCLQGNDLTFVNKIIITASGGPFRNFSYEQLKKVTVEDALKHPNWVMGQKITIDSATLMNKGLELIEAKHLFNLNLDQIDIIVHPESIIHSMVEYIDGSIIAQMGIPDMKIPISYSLTFPSRAKLPFPKMDFMKYNNLSFYKPDIKLFKCLGLAIKSIKIGGTMPAVLNASNEICVDLFLNKKINFLDIPLIIENTMNAYNFKKISCLDDILKADSWARNFVLEYFNEKFVIDR